MGKENIKDDNQNGAKKSDTIIAIVEKGFQDFSASLGEVIAKVAEIEDRVIILEDETSKLKKKEKKNEKGNSSDLFDQILTDLTSIYQDYDVIIAPLVDVVLCVINIDSMLEGTEPKSDVEIAEYVKKTFGDRGLHYINVIIKAASTTSRVTLTRLAKRIKKMISTNEFDNEGADNLDKSSKKVSNKQEEDDEEEDE